MGDAPVDLARTPAHDAVVTSSLTLVLGGARSGKSRHAEALAMAAGPAPWLYLATAQAFDAEMESRIAAHRSARAEGWTTRDVPFDLAQAIAAAPPGAPVLVDCLTLWLTNVMLAEPARDVAGECERLVAAASRAPGPLVLVGNEVGLGIVPENALARRFRDAAGLLHQRLAAVADRVVFTVAGLPLVVKGAP